MFVFFALNITFLFGSYIGLLQCENRLSNWNSALTRAFLSDVSPSHSMRIHRCVFCPKSTFEKYQITTLQMHCEVHISLSQQKILNFFSPIAGQFQGDQESLFYSTLIAGERASMEWK